MTSPITPNSRPVIYPSLKEERAEKKKVSQIIKSEGNKLDYWFAAVVRKSNRKKIPTAEQFEVENEKKLS